MVLFDYFKPAKAKAKPENNIFDRIRERNNSVSAFSHAQSVATRDSNFIHDIRHDVIVNYLYQKQCSCMWIEDKSGAVEGVVLKRTRSDYLCCPPELASSSTAQAMRALNVQSAMTVKSRVVSTFLAGDINAREIPIRNGLHIQVVSTIQDLSRARKHQYAAFVASEHLLVVWDDDPSHLIHRVEEIEDDLLKIVWHSTNFGLGGKEDLVGVTETEIDLEASFAEGSKRPTMYYSSFISGLSMCLLFVLLGLGYQAIAREVAVSKSWKSLVLVLMTPVNFFLALFFCFTIINIPAQIVGPVRHLQTNSKFYSAYCMPRLLGTSLPHITIQMPVYKEGLASVIQPTIKSIKQAISTYELQGGSANIIVHDDGLQVLDEELRQERMEFYTDNNIGWTARPPHNHNGYIRKGKFKKASNMNFGLRLSNLVEERLRALERHEKWTVEDETVAYEEALQAVITQEGNAWAQGNIRFGDYILLIDSDTRVPADCLLDAASEMEQCPDVAIIQFASGVMQVSWDFFENGITFFTRWIYTAIRFSVAAGDVAPFVGHNAILRWSALQQVSFKDEDGQERFWSETSVSEDFDMALRLQIEGYLVRLAAWAGDGFKEGVSLTVYDELTRWEKYAYGCDELVFNPIKEWKENGIFTDLFKKFISSSMPLGSKLNIFAYIGTYYGIGSAWLTALINYFVIGLYNGYVDKWYVESWKIWISTAVVFSIGGNLALAFLRYRIGEKSFVPALLENFKWCMMFVVFFGGISLHVSQAILCHMFSIDMQWGATAKEVEKSNFFIEVPKIFKNFKWCFMFMSLIIAVVVIMAVGNFLPWSWKIDQMIAIFPISLIAGCHILLPIVLNPSLMTFTY